MIKILKHIIRPKSALVLIIVLLAASCKLNEKYEKPEFTREDLYRDVAANDTLSIADMPWNEMFTDTILQKLIQVGLENNLDLQVAVARMESAEASLFSSKGALLPSISTEFSYSRRFAPSTSGAISQASGFSKEQYQLYLLASWELDVWGKLRSAKRAALADLLSSEAYRRAVQTKLISDIATTYYTLLAYDKQLEITELTVKFREEYEQTMKELQKAATVTGADFMQSRANSFSAKVTIPDLKRSIRETENALSILLNRSPGPIQRSALENQAVGQSVKTGIPVMLLSNRPDVQQAEFGLRSAFEMVNSAKAYFYPSFTLTGYAPGSVSNNEFVNLFDPSNIFARVMGGLVQPIFNKNINKARLRSNQAAQKEALATYEKTLLTAGQEVSNALYSYDVATEKIDIRTYQIEALKNAVDYNQELLKYSSASYVDVLTSQQNLLSAQLSSVNDQLEKLSAVVDLYRSLGGGW